MNISKRRLKELINNMIKYIENCETCIDNEWGECRLFKEILEDDDAPNVYYECIKILNYLEVKK